MHSARRTACRVLAVSVLCAVGSGAHAAAEPLPVADPILPEESAAIRRHFAIDQPWETLARAPAQVRRHRGFVALLTAGNEPDTAPLEPLPLPPTPRTEALLRELFAGRDLLAEKRNEFGWAYYSPADGSGQPLVLRVPQDYDPRKTYPLVVILHGLGQRPRPDPDLKAREPVILAWPWGRGDTGYRGLGGQDVRDAIDALQSWYAIDAQRIFLLGFSMGGHGVWSLSGRQPYRFAGAAAISGWPQPDLLDNLRSIPLFIRHGTDDTTVPALFSRYAHTRLRLDKSPMDYQEIRGAGHGLGTPVFKQALDWFRSCPPAGSRFQRIKLETPVDLNLPGLTGEAFAQPHQPAWVELHPPAAGSALPRMTSQNLLKIRLAPSGPGVVIDGQTLHPADAAGEIWVQRDRRWVQDSTDARQPRDYRAGAAANLFDGEPLRIVIAADGSAGEFRKRAAQAQALARFAGAGKPMAAGAIPVRTDRDLTETERAHCNLILVGDPRHHAEIRRILPNLPFQLNTDDAWVIAGQPYARTENGLLGLYFNPRQPARWIYLIIPPSSETRAQRWLDNPAQLFPGADGLNRLGQPDLVITSPERGDRLWRQFDRGWTWRDGPSRTNRLATTTVWEWEIRRQAETLVASNRADGFLLGPPENRVLRRIDPEVFTEASAAGSLPQSHWVRLTLPDPVAVKSLAKTRGFRLYPSASTASALESFRLLVPFDLLWAAPRNLPERLREGALEPLESHE